MARDTDERRDTGRRASSRLDVPRNAGLANAIELHPCASSSRAHMESLVALRLRVHPDERGERHPGALENVELLERSGTRHRLDNGRPAQDRQGLGLPGAAEPRGLRAIVAAPGLIRL